MKIFGVCCAAHTGGLILFEVLSADPFTPLDSVQTSRLDNADPSSYKKIYCECGRIVDIDRQEYETKVRLHKKIECAFCRNVRIAKELSMLDIHYSFIENPDGQ